LEALYRKRHETVLKSLASTLANHIADCFKGQPRIDRISARAKDVSSFLNKAEKMDGRRRKYSEPLHQIQDQVGARIITFYRSDADRLDKIVGKYFRAIESKDHVPDSEWEFGYFGRHHVLVIPSDVIDDDWDKAMVPKFFELQIKTLFQHAWSEAEHDVGYKEGEKPLSLDQKRRLAFTSAQAWGADRIFEELFQELLTPVPHPVDTGQN
jgi:ppGpp synthetase/RelA/SpoT-type nucleotidyltranferase